jgi:hypothetical protein
MSKFIRCIHLLFTALIKYMRTKLIGSQDLEGSAHLLSRALVNQTALNPLTHALSLSVLHPPSFLPVMSITNCDVGSITGF